MGSMIRKYRRAAFYQKHVKPLRKSIKKLRKEGLPVENLMKGLPITSHQV